MRKDKICDEEQERASQECDDHTLYICSDRAYGDAPRPSSEHQGPMRLSAPLHNNVDVMMGEGGDKPQPLRYILIAGASPPRLRMPCLWLRYPVETYLASST